MRTLEEVRAEVKSLQEIKPKVIQTTFFGDDNHAAIDAQIEVLERRLSENTIFDKWDNDYLRDAALEARAWLDSEVESLTDSWKSLAA